MAKVPMDGFTIGCDPELFLHDDEGKIVSAVGIIPGTKKEPFKLDGGAVQLDGMAAEINIEPASTFQQFNERLNLVLRQVRGMLPTGYGFSTLPAVTFAQSIMDATPDSAKELGCDPDYNAWTGAKNEIPDTSKTPGLRTAAGHIHIGWDKDLPPMDPTHFQLCRDLTMQLDWFLGAWSIKLDPDTQRRKLYGKAGAMRPKSYGVEYRVLSNFWLFSSSRREMVWNRTLQAIEDMEDRFYPSHPTYSRERIERIINNGESGLVPGPYPVRSISPEYSAGVRF